MITAMPTAPDSEGGLRNRISRPTRNAAASAAFMGPRKASCTPPRVRGAPLRSGLLAQLLLVGLDARDRLLLLARPRLCARHVASPLLRLPLLARVLDIPADALGLLLHAIGLALQPVGPLVVLHWPLLPVESPLENGAASAHRQAQLEADARIVERPPEQI